MAFDDRYFLRLLAQHSGTRLPELTHAFADGEDYVALSGPNISLQNVKIKALWKQLKADAKTEKIEPAELWVRLLHYCFKQKRHTTVIFFTVFNGNPSKHDETLVKIKQWMYKIFNVSELRELTAWATTLTDVKAASAYLADLDPTVNEDCLIKALQILMRNQPFRYTCWLEGELIGAPGQTHSPALAAEALRAFWTHLQAEAARKAVPLVVIWGQFLAWCGEENVFQSPKFYRCFDFSPIEDSVEGFAIHATQCFLLALSDSERSRIQNFYLYYTRVFDMPPVPFLEASFQVFLTLQTKIIEQEKAALASRRPSARPLSLVEVDGEAGASTALATEMNDLLRIVTSQSNHTFYPRFKRVYEIYLAALMTRERALASLFSAQLKRYSQASRPTKDYYPLYLLIGQLPPLYNQEDLLFLLLKRLMTNHGAAEALQAFLNEEDQTEPGILGLLLDFNFLFNILFSQDYFKLHRHGSTLVTFLVSIHVTRIEQDSQSADALAGLQMIANTLTLTFVAKSGNLTLKEYDPALIFYLTLMEAIHAKMEVLARGKSANASKTVSEKRKESDVNVVRHIAQAVLVKFVFFGYPIADVKVMQLNHCEQLFLLVLQHRTDLNFQTYQTLKHAYLARVSSYAQHIDAAHAQTRVQKRWQTFEENLLRTLAFSHQDCLIGVMRDVLGKVSASQHLESAEDVLACIIELMKPVLLLHTDELAKVLATLSLPVANILLWRAFFKVLEDQQKIAEKLLKLVPDLKTQLGNDIIFPGLEAAWTNWHPADEAPRALANCTETAPHPGKEGSDDEATYLKPAPRGYCPGSDGQLYVKKGAKSSSAMLLYTMTDEEGGGKQKAAAETDGDSSLPHQYVRLDTAATDANGQEPLYDQPLYGTTTSADSQQGGKRTSLVLTGYAWLGVNTGKFATPGVMSTSVDGLFGNASTLSSMGSIPPKGDRTSTLVDESLFDGGGQQTPTQPFG